MAPWDAAGSLRDLTPLKVKSRLLGKHRGCFPFFLCIEKGSKGGLSCTCDSVASFSNVVCKHQDSLTLPHYLDEVIPAFGKSAICSRLRQIEQRSVKARLEMLHLLTVRGLLLFACSVFMLTIVRRLL